MFFRRESITFLLIHTFQAQTRRKREEKVDRREAKCWWESEQTQPTLSRPFHPSCWTNKMSRGVPRYLIIKKRKKMKKKLLRGGGAKLSATEASGALNAGWRDL